jgi:hypothetical protein
MRRSPILASVAALTILAVAGCGGGSSTPTSPVVTASPTPPPTTAPSTTPSPAGLPQASYASACGSPLPPLADAYGFKVKLQFEPSPDKKIINASPQVANGDYCRALGLIANVCNTRDENDPSRVPCDHYLTGISDEGRPGPNWFYKDENGELHECLAPGNKHGISQCNVNSSNQYLLDIRKYGTFLACGSKGSTQTCGECTISEADFDKQHTNPAGVCK